MPSSLSAVLTDDWLHNIANNLALKPLDAPPHAPHSKEEWYGYYAIHYRDRLKR